ncbi:hypothetical protein Patl1_07806 [Pistacia atlantica]|uniref:Uncharacterized protein n=1 Tax=Pistacia atlantica TaxID=434234 RepID=A0ACC1AHB4_9ROSI|nr:hypothetical protein Patl1_07806 [Pistacia atlantica]
MDDFSFARNETKFLQFVGLEKVWDVKPLVTGKEIMSVLQLKSGGPLVREWQQKLPAWQLAHPSGIAEACLDWMKETHSKRILRLDKYFEGRERPSVLDAEVYYICSEIGLESSYGKKILSSYGSKGGKEIKALG